MTVLKLKGCEITASGKTGSCTSPSAGSGEIVTSTLGGIPVYDKESTKEVGLVFKPEGTTIFAEFTCVVSSIKETMTITGGVLDVLTPTNTKTTALKLEFKQKAGKQEPAEYEVSGTKVKEHLETKGTGSETFSSPSSIEATALMAPAEPLEVTA